MREEWKCVMMAGLELYATTIGTMMMPWWCADNWDIPQQVCINVVQVRMF